jgi:amino acid adenylation domain-containing protein
MTTSEYISYLHSLDIKLWYEGDNLRLNAPKGVLTPELRNELTNRKAEILAYLQMISAMNQSSVPPLQPVSRNGKLPLSFSQQRLWILDQLEPNNVAYNITLTMRLNGALNEDVLKQTLNEIVRRHEALRTIFAIEDGQPVQRIVPYTPIKLTKIDLREKSEADRDAEAKRLRMEEEWKPFDLAHDPLIRPTLIQLAEEEYHLLVATHHIASDDWSIGVFYEEFQKLYESFLLGLQSPLPELTIQYADFAHWQRQWLQGEILENLLAYWKQQLGDDLPITELPADHPRPVEQTFRGGFQYLILSPAFLSSLNSLNQQEGATLFMTLLTAFKVLIYRYTGQLDVVVGSPIANRKQVEIEKLIGFFINNLVLRSDLSGNPSFRELLNRVRETALGAYAHQDLPFELLVESLRHKRDVSRTPLFQIMFIILQNAPSNEIKLPELTLHSMDMNGQEKEHDALSKYDLTVYAWGQEKARYGHPAGLYLSFEYNSDLYEASTIRRMMGNFRTLLEAIVANPDELIENLHFLTEEERRQILVEWNDTTADYAKDKCINELIEAQVEQTPDSVAVAFEDESLTYKDLNERANQLARYLEKSGVGPDVFVGIYMERSLEMMVGLLGVLKAGGAYLPLDPSFPKERLTYMLADSQAEIFLTQKRLLGDAPEHQAKVICIDEDWPDIARESRENTASKASPRNLAYTIYTSGSTGRPKGVQIEHRSLVNFLESMRREPGLNQEDILLAVTTLSFDIAGLELFLPLLVGGQVALVSSVDAADGSRLIDLLDETGATVLQATPATWRLLLASGWQGRKGLKILCGGEAMPRDLADQLLEQSESVWNMYGPTETTVWSAVKRVEPGEGIVSIGRPIANTQIYILDNRMQPVPIGATGELYIGGDGLARGYLNRPELTAEKFIADPFNDDPDARLYRTGDLARYLADGNIEFFGRIDHQVKVRGFRIELGEIEAVLEQHPLVEQVVVIAREDIPGDKRLVGYMLLANGVAPSISELRSFLKESLPDYMVPSAFMFVETFPLTPNKKIDRRALPAPDAQRPELSESFVAPETDLEQRIASIWQEVLNLERVGVDDNFFELGGHSLLIVQVHNRLQQEFDKDISIADMFRYPTISSLAGYFEREQDEDTAVQKVQKRMERRKRRMRARTEAK